MWAEYGTTNRWGRPATVATELHENGLDGLVRANRDRRAGYVRLLELLHVEPGRIPPAWADVPAQVGGAPRLYVFETCPNVAEQLKNARVKKDGKDAVEIVDPDWETRNGHAHASGRYGAMSRPGPAPSVPEEPDDWRTYEQQRLLKIHDDQSRRYARRYVDV